jgi:dCTP diphosphatase
MDSSTTIGDLRGEVADFVAARKWNGYHTPKNLAMSIAIEAAEIMEHFQWISLAEAGELAADPAAQAEIADELADVLIYCLSFANATEIDIATAVRTKLARNENRFPIERVKGKLGPYLSE